MEITEVAGIFGRSHVTQTQVRPLYTNRDGGDKNMLQKCRVCERERERRPTKQMDANKMGRFFCGLLHTGAYCFSLVIKQAFGDVFAVKFTDVSAYIHTLLTHAQ